MYAVTENKSFSFFFMMIGLNYSHSMNSLADKDLDFYMHLQSKEEY